MFWWASCTSARHAGNFDCLMTSLILITMDNGRGHCAYWQSCKVPNQTHRGMKKFRKMYAIKQIKICAEYRDMLPRPRLDLSGTPGLRPIGLSPGSWQISLGLGSMSRYSAQILICIFHRSYARIMGEVSFGDIWYILSQCHAKGSRLIMQLINHGRGCPCFILALLKLNKGIYIIISWNNGSAILALQNDNQTLCYECFYSLSQCLNKNEETIHSLIQLIQ